MSAGAANRDRAFDAPQELARRVADWILERARDGNRRFGLCLSGGATPKSLYELVRRRPLVRGPRSSRGAVTSE